MSKAQRTARCCPNNYWLILCQNIKFSSNTGNPRGMYDGIEKAVGVKKTAHLKSLTCEILTDRNKQTESWAQHYVELYSRETVATDTALDGVGGLPVMGEIDND